MKRNEESGFILMIVIMLVVAVFIIGFAVYRITQANTDVEVLHENNPTVIIG